MNSNVKVGIHANLCDELHKLYVNKNNDYGDSFAKVRSEYPNAIAIRLMDKLERIKQLLKENHQSTVPGESIDDNLMDLANYCLLELIERRLARPVNALADSDALPSKNRKEYMKYE